MDGLFIINKPKNMTSHDVIFKVRKILQTKKVGHVGTLDPLATGVLPILVGKATKISKYLIEHNKEYEAVLQLGEKRDTADSEGKCIETREVPNDALEKNRIEEVLASMIGKQMQIPPMYSAIKVNGKKLYEYARNGLDVKVEPRQIEIFKLNLTNINSKLKTICINVSCSKGTYIRTVCEDIAEKLGTVGYMKELKRISVSNFLIQKSITLDELELNKENTKFLSENLLKIEEIFEKNVKINLNSSKLHHFLNGVMITQKMQDGLYKIYNEDGKFIGLGTIKNELLKRDVILEE